jgi:hypothetical protein
MFDGTFIVEAQVEIISVVTNFTEKKRVKVMIILTVDNLIL